MKLKPMTNLLTGQMEFLQSIRQKLKKNSGREIVEN